MKDELYKWFQEPLHYNETGVRMNTICPELTDTPLTHALSPDNSYHYDKFGMEDRELIR